ncbi:MAG: 16S rRNA (uracil(1498)-N(3))-methyltransferase [Proteobacteria bacterium]|nr:16S rRNA (uracil(1498)-N(3))-methyltransferase [Pseudomonadota bacterium]
MPKEPASSTPARPRARLHAPADLSAAGVRLEGGPAHYLRNVLRLPAGSLVALFNARDGEHAAEIAEYGKHSVDLAMRGQRRKPGPEPDLWLVFAPIKRAHLDFVAEKATELGVSALWPVITRHTNVERVNADRLLATAIEASEQSERLSVPEIRNCVPLAKAIADWPKGRGIVLCDEGGGGEAIARVLAREDLTKPWAILTGPEGGFAAEELEMLRKHPEVRSVGLGPRVLRADTAAIAALAVFQSLAPGADFKPRFAPS